MKNAEKFENSTARLQSRTRFSDVVNRVPKLLHFYRYPDHYFVLLSAEETVVFGALQASLLHFSIQPFHLENALLLTFMLLAATCIEIFDERPLATRVSRAGCI